MAEHQHASPLPGCIDNLLGDQQPQRVVSANRGLVQNKQLRRHRPDRRHGHNLACCAAQPKRVPVQQRPKTKALCHQRGTPADLRLRSPQRAEPQG